MGGLGFLLVIFLYFACSLLLLIFAPRLKYKLLVLLAVLLIPSADAIYGRMKLKQMCEADGGIRVLKLPHEDIEGYMNNYDEPDDYAVKNGMFKFSESEERNGVCTRASIKNGELIYEKGVKPISKYKDIGWKTFKLDDAFEYADSIVETYPEEEILVRFRTYFFRGGWAESFLGGFADAGPDWVHCTGQKLEPRELLLTLKTGGK